MVVTRFIQSQSSLHKDIGIYFKKLGFFVFVNKSNV